MKQLFVASLLLALTATAATAQYKVDYEFAPARWLTPIGLIDDWQKSMVDEQGRLAYDFGPGPYVRPLTTVAVEVVGAGAETISQTLLNARTPIILTEHRDGTHQWRQTAFAIIPDEPQPSVPMSPDGSYRRHEGLVGSPAWAAAADGRDASFRSVAWGTGRSIRYDIRVPTGSSRRVALGFIEVYKSRIGSRSMDFLVEGAAMQTVDLIESGGQHVPQVFFFEARDRNRDGWLEIEVTGTPGGQDPNTFINGIWVFQPLESISAEDVIAGRATQHAETHVDTGTDLLRAGHVRMDVLRAVADGAEGTVQVRVNTLRPLTVETSSSTLQFDGVPFVTTQPSFDAATETENGWLLSFPTGTRTVDVLVTHGSNAAPIPFPDLGNAQRRVAEYWQKADLPWDRITVPDQDIQDLLDGGVRTLYQVRERVDGYAQFQPGASVYRGLWFGDGVWGAETAALLDDGEAARQALDGMLQHQDDDGRVGVMKPALLHRETAHLIYGMCRYARLHQDWDWLEDRWEQLDLAMNFLIHLRREASKDPGAVYDGLFPPGLTDGGVAGVCRCC